MCQRIGNMLSSQELTTSSEDAQFMQKYTTQLPTNTQQPQYETFCVPIPTSSQLQQNQSSQSQLTTPDHSTQPHQLNQGSNNQMVVAKRNPPPTSTPNTRPAVSTPLGVYSAVYSGVPVYEIMCRNVAVMRRKSDSFLNATQILKVAGIDKGRRTKILEKEISFGEHEKVQGGYGKYQGTWYVLHSFTCLYTNN